MLCGFSNLMAMRQSKNAQNQKVNVRFNSGYSGPLKHFYFFFSYILLRCSSPLALATLQSFFLFSVYPSLCFFFSLSLSAVPPHIHSRGLSRLLTFLWPSSYYVGTIRFILTRFTNVTLTTLLSACVCLCACVCVLWT